MENVKYTPVIGKYTRSAMDKPRQAVRLPRRREGAGYWLGVAGTLLLYLAVMVWAAMAAAAG